VGLPDPKAFAAPSLNPLYFLAYTLISSILLSSIARPSQLDSNQVKKVANKTYKCYIRAVASGRSSHKP
jgi:hypothetical protein